MHASRVCLFWPIFALLFQHATRASEKKIIRENWHSLGPFCSETWAKWPKSGAYGCLVMSLAHVAPSYSIFLVPGVFFGPHGPGRRWPSRHGLKLGGRKP